MTSLSYMREAGGTNYAGGYGTNLITGVTDPYGRTVSLGYDTSALLTTITDVAGMTSYMEYNELGWVTNLSTPYGPTSFELADNGVDNPERSDRSITITEPNNSQH